MYKLKYLKYKKKYLNLKNNLKGGNNNAQPNDIFSAVENDNEELVRNLIVNNRGVVDQINDQGDTPLFIAIKNFNIRMINLLIENRATINLFANGRTALHIFIDTFIKDLSQAEDLLNALIDGGAKANSLDLHNINVLSYFIMNVLHKEDKLTSNNLTQDEVSEDDALNSREKIYINLLKILISSIPEGKIIEAIDHEDFNNISVFDYLNNRGGYIGNIFKQIFINAKNTETNKLTK